MRWVASWTLALVVGACDGDDAEALPKAWQSRADELTTRACTKADECACELSSAAAPCTTVVGDRWRARLVAGRERELEWDDECAAAIGEAIDASGCARPPAGADHPCHAFCQVLHGDRELGDSCHGLDALVSDCAQGLTCDRGRCVEPCSVLTGLAQGEVCRDVSGVELDRCADGLVCADTNRCAPALAIGAPCSGGHCDRDAYCAWYERTPVCRPAAVEGMSCDYAECASGLSCRYDDALGSAVCVSDAELGEACDVRSCAMGLYCVDLQCRPPAGVGAPCRDVPCADDLVCDYTTTICGEPPAIGAPCDAGVCAQGAWCDATATPTSCRALLADDEPCSGHSQCASGYCPAGACRPRPTLGEDCSGTLACVAGSSCDGAICRESATVGPTICVYDGW